MPLPQYVAAFFTGAFLANAVPHFVHGISGDRFPTPFARPPGKGLSSPTLNVVWALLNLVVGHWLLRGGPVARGEGGAPGAFLAGAALLSLLSSVHFAARHRPQTASENRKESPCR